MCMKRHLPRWCRVRLFKHGCCFHNFDFGAQTQLWTLLHFLTTSQQKSFSHFWLDILIMSQKIHLIPQILLLIHSSLFFSSRPFQRTVTMHKDSSGHVGFIYKSGKITSLVKDGSAARNGLLTEHYICEINGQNIIGLKVRHKSCLCFQ